MRHRHAPKTPRTLLYSIGLAVALLLAIPFLSNTAQASLLGTAALVSLFIVGIGLYFLPSLFALGGVRFWAILAANLLLAWTLIGWAVILVWAIAERSTRRS